MAEHIKYCRSPEYRKYKKEYDKNREWGDYKDSIDLIEEIEKIVVSQFDTDYERRKARGYYFSKYGHTLPAPIFYSE